MEPSFSLTSINCFRSLVSLTHNLPGVVEEEAEEDEGVVAVVAGVAVVDEVEGAGVAVLVVEAVEEVLKGPLAGAVEVPRISEDDFELVAPLNARVPERLALMALHAGQLLFFSFRSDC